MRLLNVSTCISLIIGAGIASLPLSSQAEPLDTFKVKAQMVERVVPLPAELMPFEGTDLYAKVNGYVQDISVDRGSVVKKDQVIAKLIAPEMQTQVAEAESKLASTKSKLAEAEANMTIAKKNYEQLKEAAKTPGAIAELEVLRARESYVATNALVDAEKKAVDAAKAAAETTHAMDEYLSITAPFDGQIVRRNIHTGALVGPTMEPLVRVEQLNHLRLVVAVPEQEVGTITPGRALDFKVSAFPAKTFSGVVSRLAGSNDVKTRSMPIELDVDNASGELAPGMYPEVQWPVTRASAALLVPPTAVVTTTERRFVIRVSADGKAEWVDVRQGSTYGDLIEVIGALKPGDTIVARGTDEIRVGAPVEAKTADQQPGMPKAPAADGKMSPPAKS